MLLSDFPTFFAIRSLTNTLEDHVFLPFGTSELLLVQDKGSPVKSKRLKKEPTDLAASVYNLQEKGYVKICSRVADGLYFHRTYKMSHWIAFFWEDLMTRFWAGFIAGFASAITGALAIYLTIK